MNMIGASTNCVHKPRHRFYYAGNIAIHLL